MANYCTVHESCYNSKAMVNNPDFLQPTNVQNANTLPPDFFGRVAQEPLGLHILRNALTAAGVTHVRLLAPPGAWTVPYVPNATVVNMNTTASEIAERLDGSSFSSLATSQLRLPIGRLTFSYQGALRMPQRKNPQSRAVIRAHFGRRAADTLAQEAVALRGTLGLPQRSAQVDRVRWFDVAEVNGPTTLLQSPETGTAIAGLAREVIENRYVFGKLGAHPLNSRSKPNKNLL